ncbi:putative mitochondrial protein [Tanacetum coccineum]
MTKVYFLKFSGADVKGWIFRYEQFFSIDVHLFDKALLWHRQFIKLNGENVSWNFYKIGILQRFGTLYDDPVSEIRNVKYGTNAKNYQDAFDKLLSRVEMSEERVVSLYLRGCQLKIEMWVRMFRPKTLVDAYCLTNLQEATLNAVKKKNYYDDDDDCEQTVELCGDDEEQLEDLP